MSWGLPGRLRWPGGNAHRPRAHEPALPLQPGQIQLRPLPVVLHASDKSIKREPYGLSGPPNLSEKDSELTGTCGGCGGR
jgi:hypothetical protein